jgi:hypothetical protein
MPRPPLYVGIVSSIAISIEKYAIAGISLTGYLTCGAASSLTGPNDTADRFEAVSF